MKRKILSWLLVFSMFITMLAGSTVPVTADVASSYGYDETDADSVKVAVTISNDGMPIMGRDENSTPLSHLDVEVPYFDLAEYDLQDYYRYGTADGQGTYVNTTVVKRPTVLHLYIYLLERYFMGLPEEQCGQGKASGLLSYSDTVDVSYINGEVAYNSAGYNAINITGASTSLYLSNFWGHDENLMYYRNHRYPLMSGGWGATADYVLLSEGDCIDLAMFSNWDFHTSGAFLSFDKDEYTAEAGSNLTVTTMKTATSAGLGGSETPVEVFAEEVVVALYDSDWNKINTEVTINGDGTYAITMPETAGTYYVMANDLNAKTSESDKAPATAKITVPEQEKETIYEVTVNVAPTAAAVTFYEDADAETALTKGVTDNGTVGNYHQYVLNVPKGTYSYRGVEDETDLGGMTFEVPFDEEIMGDGSSSGKGMELTLVRANYYTTNSLITAVGDYELQVMPGSLPDAVCGQQYINDKGYVVTPVLVTARGNALVYNWNVTLKGSLAETHAVASTVNAIFSDSLKAATNKTFSLTTIETYTITAPTGASVQMYNQLKNFKVEEIPAKSFVENVDDTVTYTFKHAKSANLTYRVSMDDKITRAGYFKNSGQDITITFDENENPKSTENIMDNAAMQKRVESSTMLNVNGQNDLSLAVDDTFRLRAYRGAWQIINTDTANIMIEPDFHYEILEGKEHIEITPVTNVCTGNAKNNWYDIKGLSEGIAIVEVKYDAIIVGGDGTSFDGQYGATDPQRTSLFVIHVGAEENTLTMTADGSANTWDTEYDTVYFTGDTGSLTFVATVDNATPDAVELSTDKGKTWTNVSLTDEKFTANGLVGGNNILRFTKGNTVEYQVVRAAKVTCSISNQTRQEDIFIEGDVVKVVFDGLYTPVSKFSGIYNPGFGQGHKVTYTLPDGTTATATGGQYDFISTNTYTITLDTLGQVNLTGGYIAFNVMGVADPLGGHRLLTDAGVGANFSAVSTQHTRSVLPNITLDVIEMPSIPVTVETDVTTAAIVVKDADGNQYTSENGVYTLDYGTYKYEITAEGYVTERGKFVVGSGDGAQKVISFKLRKIEGAIWDGSSVTAVSPNAAGIYELSTGSELAWFAQQVNAGTGVSWNAILMKDISLGGIAWTPMTGYKGTFDGDGHMITDLYIDSTAANQGLFGDIAGGAVIQNLGVSGQVTSTNKYVGGIAGKMAGNTTIQNCVNYVDVIGSQNVGGIVGYHYMNTAKVINCYNQGNIIATSKLAGGISGGFSASSAVYIENSYSTGTVTCPKNGGALTASTSTSKIMNSYYLEGAYSSTSKAGTSKTATELKMLSTILGDAYAVDIFGRNGGYPMLTWQQTEEDKAAIVLVEAKTEAKEELAGYKNADDYREAQKTELATAIASGSAAIDAATVVEAVNQALAKAKAVIDEIKTDAQLKQEESVQPSETPSEQPSEVPSEEPSEQPSEAPSEQPSEAPSEEPSEQASATPSKQPSEIPSEQASETPSEQASTTPSEQASTIPSEQASETPSQQPSETPSEIPSKQPGETQKPMSGDLDNNNKVELRDAQLALKIALKIITPTPEQEAAVDVTGDGKVDLFDAQKILKVALKIEKFES